MKDLIMHVMAEQMAMEVATDKRITDGIEIHIQTK